MKHIKKTEYLKNFVLLFSLCLNIYLIFTRKFKKNINLNKNTPIQIEQKKDLFLYKYSIDKLENLIDKNSSINLVKKINIEKEKKQYNLNLSNTEKYLYTLKSSGFNISGHIYISDKNKKTPIIILLRGYYPQASFKTGVSTDKIALFLAKNGFSTISIDFLGYGSSDKELKNLWENRFIKPKQVLDLIDCIKNTRFFKNNKQIELPIYNQKIGLWGYSNGGQIAVSVLEASKQDYPTVLWAPMLAPFPYSILSFSYSDEDQGKSARFWVHDFEKDYDSTKFSITTFIKDINADIQIHQSLVDTSINTAWIDDFVKKFKQTHTTDENLSFKNKNQATNSTDINQNKIFNINYYKYNQSDHFIQQVFSKQTDPLFMKMIDKDVLFFKQHLY